MIKTYVYSLIIAAAATISTAASAATVIEIVGTRGSNSAHVFGEVTCSVSCQGVLANGSLSETTAFAFNIGNSSEATEAATLNTLLGGTTSFSESDADKEDNGTSPFQFFGQYVALKTGPVTSFLANSAGVAQTLTYVGFQQGGLSHKTNIGELPGTPPPAVPLPAAGWLLLSAALGLGATRRRRKA